MIDSIRGYSEAIAAILFVPSLFVPVVAHFIQMDAYAVVTIAAPAAIFGMIVWEIAKQRRNERQTVTLEPIEYTDVPAHTSDPVRWTGTDVAHYWMSWHRLWLEDEALRLQNRPSDSLSF